MFAPGDIVRIFAPIASKHKFHLCVMPAWEEHPNRFLFFNSHGGNESDFPIDRVYADCLPQSATGISVLSCSLVVRYTDAQLSLFQAKELGKISPLVCRSLSDFIRRCQALTNRERIEIANEIEAYGYHGEQNA